MPLGEVDLALQEQRRAPPRARSKAAFRALTPNIRDLCYNAAVITNAGLVAGVIIGVGFLIAGILLWQRVPTGGGMIVTAGALVTLAAAVYALVVLKPFVGRPYEEGWHDQISTVEALATLGLLICAAGMVAHAIRLPRR